MIEAVAVDVVGADVATAAFEAVAFVAVELGPVLVFVTAAVAVVVGNGIVVAEAVGNEWTAGVVGGDGVVDGEHRDQPLTELQLQQRLPIERRSS